MLRINKLCKRTGDFALRDISIHVEQGDYFVLLGVSGSGKSMLLEHVAGLEKPDSGAILLNGRDITRAGIQSRGTGMVFQDSAVFPHMSVFDNIAYPLKSRAVTKSDIRATVGKWAQLVGIESLLKRRPGKLSGGELRRVALARTLAMNPEILLLDEPLSSLDVLLQFDMMRLLSRIHDEGQTVMHVTHDYQEAWALATHLAVMHKGQIIQAGTPKEVFSKPGNAFVAGLTGIKNYFCCYDCVEKEGHYELSPGNGLTLISSHPVAKGYDFYIRAEDIVVNPATAPLNHFEAVIEDVFPFYGGADVVLNAGIPLHAHLSDETMKTLEIRKGANVWIGFSGEAVVGI